MSCLSKIKNCSSFTETEQRLQEFILAHTQTVIYESAQSFAHKTNTSPAAIIRFSKKLGYKGFTQLKMDLAKYDLQDSSNETFQEKIEEHDSLETIVLKMQQADLNTIEETYELLRIEALEQAIKYLQNADKIYLIGIGASGVCCLDFTQKLTRVGKSVTYYADFHMQLAAMSHVKKEDCVLAISYSGNTNEINLALKVAREVQASIIGITQLSKNPMHKFCDALLYVPKSENELRLGALSSRNASMILIDLLYTGMICPHLNDYKTKLTQSRKLIKELS